VDAVCIVNRHRAFADITLNDLTRLMPHHPILMDVKNMFTRAEAERLGFIYLSL
jgi:UDP-N-acetyl-D-mannosaminuronate dehydrogenase